MDVTALRNCGLLFLAGGAGALARYGVSELANTLVGRQYPLGTFVVNVLGCFLFGLIWELAAVRLLIPDTVRLIILVEYQDINYQLSQNEDKTAIFEGWCDFLNYFDSSIQFQLSFLNLAASRSSFSKSITIPPQGDGFDHIRAEYTEMLQNQLAKGNNGLVKTKYLTFGIEAENVRAAKPRLERIETDVINNFKRLGVACEPMDGKGRLRLMHDIFRMDEQEPFHFSWDWLAPSVLSLA